ncbi:6282_t:CDS:1 [Ambispora gerdemannii]|uniref:6282_t:CDS:1 n=1 Tax=Ambispora gerdemannii TaxID=144530 RepID=A0A9N8VYR8_9GLOM|nr:6282_t:CDS:1 [Ambispora gerdemannii]
MVRKYYCDYCDRSFPDNAGARKKHLDGAQHQLAVKLHYDSFRNPVELLLENVKRPACRKFQDTGYCQFGLSCRYSHVNGGIDFSQVDPAIYLSRNLHLLNAQQKGLFLGLGEGGSGEGNLVQNSQVQYSQTQRQSSAVHHQQSQVPITRYKLPGLPKDLPLSLRFPPYSGYDFSRAAQWG